MIGESVTTRYRLIHRLGEGGMGIVYTALDRLRQEKVAIKLVNLVGAGWEEESSHHIRLEMAQEFKLLASLRHPHIISVLDYGFDQEQHPYYTMELLAEGDTILTMGQHLPEAEKIKLLIQLLQALVYLHRRGIIHRDLKPANVMVQGDQVKVLDFGLAVTRQYLEESDDSQTAGTLTYMAPELFVQRRATEASDIYAVGVIAYQLLAGMHPFKKASVNQMIQEILTATPEIKLVSPNPIIRDLVARMLAKSPEDRPQDLQAVIQTLAEVIEIPIQQEQVQESFLQAASFVGREKERGQLLKALDKLKQQEGSLWLVGGESGVGKSRLLDDVRTQALVNGAWVVRGQAIYESGAPYVIWREVLPLLCLETIITSLETSVLKSLIPNLEQLLEMAIPDAPEMDAQAAQNRLFSTIVNVFSRQKHPLVVILEDVHWANESLPILTALQRVLPELPILVLASYRHDEMPELPEQFPQAHTLQLNRLSTSEIADLSAAILGEQIGRREDLVGLLDSETEGNVFFMVEVMRALAEEAGSLNQIGLKTLPTRVFAAGMQAIILRRLERLPESARPLLQAAAILGRQLDLNLLRHLSQTVFAADQIDLDSWLVTCSTLLEVQDNRWRFSHDKLREGLLESLSPAIQRQLHRYSAEAIEAVYRDNPDYTAALAFHWGVAQIPAKEGIYSRLAGQQALDNAVYSQAVTYFKRVIELAELMGLSTEDFAEVHLNLGNAYMGIGYLHECQPLFHRVLEILGYSHPEKLRLAIATQAIQQAAFLTLPLPRYSSHSPQAHLAAALACEYLLMIYYFTNQRENMIYYAFLGLNVAEQGGLVERRGRFYSSLAMGTTSLPLDRITRLYIHQADLAAQKTLDPDSESWIMLANGIFSTAKADWNEADRYLRRGLQITQEIGHIRRWEECSVTLAGALYYEGRWDESNEIADALYKSAESQGNEQGVAWAYDDFGRYALRIGDYGTALDYFERSRVVYDAIQDKVNGIWIIAMTGKAYWCKDGLEASRPYIEHLETLLSDSAPTTFSLFEPYATVVEFYLHQLAQDPSQTHLFEKIALANHALGEYARVFPLGLSRWWSYQGWEALLHGKQSQAIRHAEKAVKLAKKYKMRYEEGLAYLNLARVLPPNERRTVLELAESILKDLNAHWELENVELLRDG